MNPFRRILRILLCVAAALSLLLCVASAVLWVRSCWVSEEVGWRRADGWRSVGSARGRLVVRLELADWSGLPAERYGLRYQRGDGEGDERPVESALVRMYTLSVGPRDTFVEWHRGGFAWLMWRPPDRRNLIAAAVVPIWAIVIVTAAPPAGWAVARWRGRARRRARERPGLCVGCGYDLRGSVGGGAGGGGGRCPECGAEASRGGRGPG